MLPAFADAVPSTVEVTPFGDDTGAFSNNRWVQRRMYTSYERDANLSDEAMHRRYNRQPEEAAPTRLNTITIIIGLQICRVTIQVLS